MLNSGFGFWSKASESKFKLFEKHFLVILSVFTRTIAWKPPVLLVGTNVDRYLNTMTSHCLLTMRTVCRPTDSEDISDTMTSSGISIKKSKSGSVLVSEMQKIFSDVLDIKDTFLCVNCNDAINVDTIRPFVNSMYL